MKYWSFGLFEHLTLTGQLEIIRALTDTLDGDITLLGSSMGGYLATFFAEDQPRVKRMVLIAPAFQFTSRYMAKMDKSLLDKWREEGYIEMYHHAYRENRRLNYSILEDARQYDRRVLQRQLPTLIIHGLRDEAVDYRLSIEHLQSHPSAQLILLPIFWIKRGVIIFCWNVCIR